MRLTEVEAYHGAGTGAVADPGSHARMGRTPRNATMWGEPGHLYVYLSHGIHSCVNVVCGPEGVAGGILLRAGEVVEGRDAAARRRTERGRGAHRTAARERTRTARRCGRAAASASTTGSTRSAASERAGAVARLHLLDATVGSRSRPGPGSGWPGSAGTGAFPWRFWIAGDPTVSAFRWGRGARSVSAVSVTAVKDVRSARMFLS